MADTDAPHPAIRLPRTFLEEVEIELRRAERELGVQHQRVEQLKALYRLSLAVEARLDKAVTVFDVIQSAAGPGELAQRQRLIEVLRPGRAEP